MILALIVIVMFAILSPIWREIPFPCWGVASAGGEDSQAEAKPTTHNYDNASDEDLTEP
jgi:hypothetical protein